MNRLIQSKATAWGAFLLIVIMLVLTFSLRSVWWAFFDVFFLFMMVFSPLASGKLDAAAFVFGILGILSLIGEYIAWQVVFG